MTLCNMAIEAGARAGMVATTKSPRPTSGPSVRAEDQRAVGCCDQILAHPQKR